MNRNVLRKRLLGIVALLCWSAPAAWAQQRTFTIDTGKSNVDFTLADVLHTVHGTFRVKSGSIAFDDTTGIASGQIVVDADSGDSGSKARDHKMKKDILETQRFPEIILTVDRIKGSVAASGTSQVELYGRLTLHGQQNSILVSGPVTLNGQAATADINFVVPYEQWGVKNPSTLFLRVSDKVQIKVHAVGTVESASAAAR